MKNLILLFALLLSTNLFSQTYPYNVETDARFTAVEDRATALEATDTTVSGQLDGAVDGSSKIQKYLRATYDVDSLGGTASSTISLGQSLPAGAVIKHVDYFIKEQLVSGSNSTLGLGCELAADLVSDIDHSFTSTNDTLSGIPQTATSTVNTYVYSSDGCDIAVNVGTGSGFQNGNVIFDIQYGESQ